MIKTDVIIVGGGLAGLYLARELQSRNINYQLLDAKPLFGGRIIGAPSPMSNTQFFDMGPTWVFPHHQSLKTLISDLDLKLFDQYTNGDALYQFESTSECRRVAASNEPVLQRIENGAYSLIRALVRQLDSEKLFAGHKVSDVVKNGTKWTVKAVHKKSSIKLQASHLVLALPPRIIAREFEQCEWMSRALLTDLIKSQTWMSAQAKCVVTYKTPFWREHGLAGQAFSQKGPMVEVHDASCSEDESFALFGFIGIAATARIHEPLGELKKQCIRQLADIFGHEAYRFDKCFVKDWAKDSDICTGQDQSEGSRHPVFEIDKYEAELASQHLYLAGSEMAREDAGYLEGALLAADAAILQLESNLQH